MCLGRKYKRWTRYTTYYLKDAPPDKPAPAKKPAEKAAEKTKKEEPDRHIFVPPNSMFYAVQNPHSAPVLLTPDPNVPPATSGAQPHIPVVPYRQSSEHQFWCRELDGGWTLRTAAEIAETCQPGTWAPGQAGWAVFTRTPPSK